VRTKVSYIGGHPLGTGLTSGTVEITDDEVVYTAAKRLKEWHSVNLGRHKFEERLTIPLTSITEVESKTKRELQNAPQGYLMVLPGIGHGYWQDRKHPANPSAKLTALLTVRFVDDVGDSQLVVFGNSASFWNLTESLQEVADAIISARYRAKRAAQVRAQ
jgi:hypothetical protein